MTERFDESSYDRAVAPGAVIANVDTLTKDVRLHRLPPGVRAS